MVQVFPPHRFTVPLGPIRKRLGCQRFHSTKIGSPMETLRFPGELRECERAGALYRNLPRQVCSQQRASLRDRGPQTGELEPAAGQAGAQTRPHPSFKQGGQGKGMIRRAESRQEKSATAPGNARAASSVRTQPAGRRRALLAQFAEEDFQMFCSPREELMRRREHMRVRARKSEARARSF